MVKKAPLLLLAAATIISCGFFAASPYPEDVILLSVEKDLSDELDGYLGGRPRSDLDFIMYTLRDKGGQESVFLGFRRHDSGETKLLILDSDLDFKKEKSHVSIGSGAVYDPGSRDAESGESFIIGEEVFDARDYRHRGNYHELGWEYIPAFESQVLCTEAFNYELRNDEGILSVMWLDKDWHFPLQIESNDQEDRYLAKLTHDADAGQVILFFERHGETEIIGLKESRFLELSGWGEYPWGSELKGGRKILRIEANPGECHYTRDGIVIARFNESTHEIVGYDGKRKSRWEADDYQDSVYAYDIRGNHYYQFNIADRTMKKYMVGWLRE